MGLIFRETREVPIDTRTEQQYVRDTLRDYFKEQKITGKAVAKALCVSPSLISLYMRGEKFLPQKIAKQLSTEYGFDEYFLTEGRTEVIIDPSTGDKCYIDHHLFPENPSEVYGNDYEHTTKEEIETEIDKVLTTLSELQKKYKNAENMIYEANRTIYSIVGSIRAIEGYINLIEWKEINSK